MDPKAVNMTGDPNQKSPQSVFGFDAYPHMSLNWAQTFGQYSGNTMQNFQPGYEYNQQLSPFANEQMSPTNPMFNTQQINSSNFNFGPSRQQDSLVQFPFQITSDSYGAKTLTQVRGKRKTDSPPLQPCKQHITEEKMAEHMSKLHISSETASTEMESDLVREKRLYMCEEMRKLQTEPIVPQCLLSRMDSPCKALVLWKPPVPLLPNFDNQDNNENNNEDSITDGNNLGENEMDMDG